MVLFKKPLFQKTSAMKLSKQVVEVARGDGMRRPFNRFVREIVDTAEEDQPRILQANLTDQGKKVNQFY